MGMDASEGSQWQVLLKVFWSILLFVYLFLKWKKLAWWTQFRWSQFPERHNQDRGECPPPLYQAVWGCWLWPHQGHRASSQSVCPGPWWPWHPQWAVCCRLLSSSGLTQWLGELDVKLASPGCSFQGICAASRAAGSWATRMWVMWLWTPFSTNFWTFKTFALASGLEGGGASFFALRAGKGETSYFMNGGHSVFINSFCLSFSEWGLNHSSTSVRGEKSSLLNIQCSKGTSCRLWQSNGVTSKGILS